MLNLAIIGGIIFSMTSEFGQKYQPEETYPHEVAKKALHMAANVAGRYTLPPRVFVVTRDVDGSIFGVELRVVKHLNQQGTHIIAGWVGQLSQDASITDIADEMLQDGNIQGKSLVCDRELADELNRASLVFLDKDHYRLEGRQGGVLEVFVPYASKEKAFSPGSILEIYTE